MRHYSSSSGLAFLVLLLAALLCGCARRAEVYTTEKAIRLSDSASIVEADYILIHSDSHKINALLEGYNQEIERGLNDTIAKFREEALETKPYLPPEMKYELYIKDSVFMAAYNFVSLRYMVYTFTGGAHGMTCFYSYNYDISAEKQLDKKSLFKPACTAQIDRVLEKYFRDPDGCFTEKPTVESATAINITPESVTFTYDQYILGAYACGPVEINVPAAELKDFMEIKDFPVGI